jgi:hypothetical protein
MPISFNQITANVASVTLHYGGQDVTIVYYPARITEKTFAELQSWNQVSAENVIDKFGELNDLLASLMKSWDVYEDDAQSQMFPLASDRLSELPIMFRMAVLQAIMGDMRPETIAPQS